MKIIENEEENNENRKGFVEIDNRGGTDESQGSGNTSDTKIMLEKVSSTQYRGRRKPRKSVAHSAVKLSGEQSEDPLDGDVAVEVDQGQVPAVTPRGRGRPRKNKLVSDAVSPLAKISATPSRGRGRPRKDPSQVIKSPLTKDSPLPSERRGRGRPKKIVDASDVIKTAEKPDEKENVDVTDLKEKADSVPRRGRGRPKKNFGNFSASTSLTAGEAISTPRRGRGRPRKNFKNIGGTPLSKGRIGHQNDFKRFGAIQLLAQALAKHGRGRPRKGTGIKDAVQLLQKDRVLSKPGRPPKSIKRMFAMKLLAKAAGTSRRGRGRPRKVVAEATGPISEKDAPAVTPRGRGRPRKNVETPDSTLLSCKAPAVTPMTPRGRGRPRKNLPTVDTAVLSSKGSLSGVMTEEL